MKNTNITGNRLDVIKANRKGSRDAGLENTSGWTAVRKTHNSKANYTRKNKHKKSGNSDFFYAQTRPRRGFQYNVVRQLFSSSFPDNYQAIRVAQQHSPEPSLVKIREIN